MFLEVHFRSLDTKRDIPKWFLLVDLRIYFSHSPFGGFLTDRHMLPSVFCDLLQHHLHAAYYGTHHTESCSFFPLSGTSLSPLKKKEMHHTHCSILRTYSTLPGVYLINWSANKLLSELMLSVPLLK